MGLCYLKWICTDPPSRRVCVTRSGSVQLVSGSVELVSGYVLPEVGL